MSWRPLNLRERPDADTEYPVLVDGVPDWLEPSLLGWVARRAAAGGYGLARRMEQRLRIRLPDSKNNEYQLVSYWRGAGDGEKLALIDCIISELYATYAVISKDASRLDERTGIEDEFINLSLALDAGGSLWKIDGKVHGLARRVTEAVEGQYSKTVSERTDAALSLKRAWAACYRQNPNYDEAYRHAVLAVEAVVLPVSLPNDQQGTLGKAIKHIKDTRSRWSVADLVSVGPTGADVLVDMLDLIWKNQQRHARPDGTIVDVTRPEAEMAVSLAVQVVHWFGSGLVSNGS